MYAQHPSVFPHNDYHQSTEPAIFPKQTIHQARGPGPAIGQPIHFATGQFAGQTIRAKLDEVQKADLGRKYARVDRRPLDPPPVILLRLFQVYNLGTDQQSEKEIKNYDDVQHLGFVCTVDLFPAPGPDSGKDSRDAGQKHLYQPLVSPHQTPYSSSLPSHTSHDPKPNFPFVNSPQSHHTNPGYVGQPRLAPDIVHYSGDYPITESSKLTQALVGATFVQPASVDYQGKKSVMFVFSDLAVKVEGTFILRYRVFDIFSKAVGNKDLSIQAECYGGPFRVYSTKEFPGLQASTELTKQLARWGVRLNIRETERKRRKKGDRRTPSPALPDSQSSRRPTDDERGYGGGYGSDDD